MTSPESEGPWVLDPVFSKRSSPMRPYTLKPCREIAPGDGSDVGCSLAERYSTLIQELPLVGADGMVPHAETFGLSMIESIRAEAPWFGPALDIIARQLVLSLWAGRPWLTWRPLCMVGPPGIGKTHLARLLATRGGSVSMTLDVGGTADARTLEGTARGWRSAQPCWPALAVAQAGIANPVLLIDELDKVDPREGADMVEGVLLAMFERSTAAKYYDRALLAEVDLSAVCWLIAVNDISAVSEPLRSRMDIVRLEGPAPAHFDLVLVSVLRDVASGLGIDANQLPELPPSVVEMVRRAFATRRSVRNLRRHIESILSMLAVSCPGTVQ